MTDIWEGERIIPISWNKCLISDFLENIVECNCHQCQNDLNKYGYNKDMIMKVVGNLLCKIRFSPDRNGKKKIVRKMFEALTEKRSILFINDYRKFRIILDKKLKELYYDESWFIAYIWYRRIFGKRLKWEENLNKIPQLN